MRSQDIDMSTDTIEGRNTEIEQELDALAVVILPETLKALREGCLNPYSGKIGMTQEDLARYLGVSVAAIKKYESRKNPSIPQSLVLTKMCDLYKTELFFSPKPELRHPALPPLPLDGES